ncbi:hypothetical protein BJ742DRAFT_783670, partial [Cladochytrium replicatum]
MLDFKDTLWTVGKWVILPIKIIATSISIYAVCREWNNASCIYSVLPYPGLMHLWNLVSTFLLEEIAFFAICVCFVGALVTLLVRCLCCCFSIRFRVHRPLELSKGRYVSLELGGEELTGVDLVELPFKWILDHFHKPMFLIAGIAAVGAFVVYIWLAVVVQRFYVDQDKDLTCNLRNSIPFLYWTGSFWLGLAYFYLTVILWFLKLYIEGSCR